MNIPFNFNTIVCAPTLYVIEKSSQALDLFKEHWVWNEHVKPLYERKIAPLTSLDYSVLTGCFFGSLLLTEFVVYKYSAGALPISAGIGTLMMLGAYHFINYRINRHFNAHAKEQLELMKKLDLSAIAKARHHLSKLEFHHLEEDLKKLDGEIDKLKTAIVTPALSPIVKKNIEDAFVVYIDCLIAKI